MNNRFCRCCFSDHNADGTICRGFLSHLSDNKHSLGSQRSGERPLDGRSVLSAGAGLPREEPPQKRTGPQQLSLALGEAGRAGSPERDLLEGPVGSPAQPGECQHRGVAEARLGVWRRHLRSSISPCHLDRQSRRSVRAHRPGITMTESTWEEKGNHDLLDPLLSALCVTHTHTDTHTHIDHVCFPDSQRAFCDSQR